ncbi:MAG: hypothetical protein M0R73_10035 [Dehalococcoidia bacterium]|nr:hypothetical protein [Dehalococcoidia bacterium]
MSQDLPQDDFPQDDFPQDGANEREYEGDAGAGGAPEGRIALLVSKSPGQAEAWARIIEEAGIAVGVEISDRQVVQPGSSPLVGVLGAQPLDFVHVVVVRRPDREAAVAALVDSGWDGRQGRAWSRRTMRTRDLLVGAAIALGGLGMFVLVRLAAS